MTNAIQQNRYDALLRRVGGIIGPGSKVSEVLTELFPMIDVENVPGELLILAGTRAAQGGSEQGGVAAQAGKYQLFNPAESGHIVTITRIQMSSSATHTQRWGRSTAVFTGTAVGTEEFTDSRNLATNRPVAELRQLSVAALANASNRLRILALTASDLHNENGIAVLSPGFGFEIGSSVLNASTYVAFNWRERVAEESELSL